MGIGIKVYLGDCWWWVEEVVKEIADHINKNCSRLGRSDVSNLWNANGILVRRTILYFEDEQEFLLKMAVLAAEIVHIIYEFEQRKKKDPSLDKDTAEFKKFWVDACVYDNYGTEICEKEIFKKTKRNWK